MILWQKNTLFSKFSLSCRRQVEFLNEHNKTISDYMYELYE